MPKRLEVVITIKGGKNLEWFADQVPLGVVVKCRQTCDHIVYDHKDLLYGSTNGH